MDIVDREYIIRNLQAQEERENTPLDPGSDYDDMSMRELKLLIEHLRHTLEEVQQSLRSKELENRRLLEMQEDLTRTNRLLQEQLTQTRREKDQMGNLIQDLTRSNDELTKMIANLSSQLSAERGDRLPKKTHKVGPKYINHG